MSPFVKMSALLALMSLLHSGSAVGDEKLTDCCTSVSRNRIKDPIIGVLRQSKSGNCVEALIFQTENRALFCIYPKAPWVRSALLQLKRKRVRATAQAVAPTSAPGPQVSLLSIITSTVQPSSASSGSPSSSRFHSSTVSPDSSSFSSTAVADEMP
uniref:Chemokine interleukin-8-like domain-containing protein n=1 Tax=Neogobius melanostomus TaxID=47308 RepID=A0A8C6TXM7_9GOBI